MIVKFDEIKKPEAVHRLRRTRPGLCQHAEMSVNEQSGQVQCKNCEAFLDPFVALMILARGTWWREMSAELEREHEAKKVSRVQSAAIEHLYRAGITPEKYKIRWEKEDAKAKALSQAKEVSLAPAVVVPDKTAS